MHKAPNKAKYKSLDEEFKYVETYVVDWYNSVIRLVGPNKKVLVAYAGKIIEGWKAYSDESVEIIACDENGQHNTLTPIARKSNDGKYIVELILRNNLTSEKYPDGVYHVHPEYQNIKSESIGLIEAMGMFILPGRLDRQLKEVASYLKGEKEFKEKDLAPDMKIHAKMIKKLIKEHGSSCSAVEAALAVKEEVNDVCANILDNTAVFKKDAQGEEAFDKFLASVNIVKA
jgi:UDPglucose--hexose-1-phosphate uridylyltransferase